MGNTLLVQFLLFVDEAWEISFPRDKEKIQKGQELECKVVLPSLYSLLCVVRFFLVCLCLYSISISLALGVPGERGKDIFGCVNAF